MFIFESFKVKDLERKFAAMFITMNRKDRSNLDRMSYCRFSGDIDVTMRKYEFKLKGLKLSLFSRSANEFMEFTILSSYPEKMKR